MNCPYCGQPMVLHRPHSRILTPHQATVLRLYVAGKPVRQIAKELCVEENAVHLHMHRIRKRLGVRTNAELFGLFFGEEVQP